MPPEAGAAVGAGILILIFIGFGLALFGLWLWSLIHCCVNKQLSDTNRIIGIVLIVVLGIIGSLVYLFLPREPYRDEDEDEDEGVDRGPAPY